jgi:D-sedoheptulose 7-phosphate isomerase
MVIKPTLWGGVAVGPAPVAEAKENEPVMLDTMIDAHIQCLERLRPMAPVLKQTGDLFLQCLLDGGKILICGNGGSASDAQHFAAEIVGRFELERRAYPAVALSTDTSILTAVGNDYGYDEVFARQVDGLGRPEMS